jgi:hypothetical protein
MGGGPASFSGQMGPKWDRAEWILRTGCAERGERQPRRPGARASGPPLAGLAGPVRAQRCHAISRREPPVAATAVRRAGLSAVAERMICWLTVRLRPARSTPAHGSPTASSRRSPPGRSVRPARRHRQGGAPVGRGVGPGPAAGQGRQLATVRRHGRAAGTRPWPHLRLRCGGGCHRRRPGTGSTRGRAGAAAVDDQPGDARRRRGQRDACRATAIAKALVLSPSTVRNHLASIGMESKAEGVEDLGGLAERLKPLVGRSSKAEWRDPRAPRPWGSGGAVLASGAASRDWLCLDERRRASADEHVTTLLIVFTTSSTSPARSCVAEQCKP